MLVYLIYLVLLMILLWKVQFAADNTWNDGFLSVGQTKCIQGFCAICIMLHHISQKTCASWLDKRYIIPGLEPFVEIGYLLVGVFLFCSGYGLYKSNRTKPNYLKGFIGKRIVPIIYSCYIFSFIYLLARILMKQRMDGRKILNYVLGIQMANPNGWYVVTLPLLYFGFWLSFRIFKKERWSLLTLTGLVMAYLVAGTCIDHNDYLLCGEWWYNSVHMFLVGVFFAKYEDKIISWIKEHYRVCLIICLILAYALFKWSEKALGIFSYYGEDFDAPDKILRRWICLISQQGASIAFMFSILLITMKVQFGNIILKFMGNITLEFYLIHGLFLELFAYSFMGGAAKSLYYIKNVPLLVIVVLIPSLIVAVCMRGLRKVLFERKKKV